MAFFNWGRPIKKEITEMYEAGRSSGSPFLTSCHKGRRGTRGSGLGLTHIEHEYSVHTVYVYLYVRKGSATGPK